MADMKNLIYILASLMLLSCVGAGGFDEQDNTNPLSECVLPESAEAGGEAIIQWDGFSKDVTVSLVSSSGKSYDMTVDVVTASGLVFLIPSDLPAGAYKVKISMGGKAIDLGDIEILTPEDVSDPDSDSKPDPDEPESEPTPEPEPEPEPDPEPDPEPGPGDDPVVPSGPKTLTGIEYHVSSGESVKWEIVRTPVPTLRVTNDTGSDVYTGNSSGYFELTSDGIEMSNNVGMTYLLDGTGSVFCADVLRYGKSSTIRYTWEYDAQSRLSEISYEHATMGEISLASFEYQSGCLTGYDNIVIEYDNPSLVNAPDASDVILGYLCSIKGVVEPALFIPYLMGWYDVKSSRLPTGMQLPDPSGTGFVKCSFSYELDDDGYVVSMSWKENKDSFRMIYVYELLAL